MLGGGNDENARAAAETVARASYGKLVAWLAARTGDVAGAEDALSDAFAAALIDWPRTGVPDKPEAWLLTVARRRGIDGIRRQRHAADAAPHVRLIAEELEEMTAPEIPDRRLALMFACAHPALDAGIRAPLILQTVLGFDAVAIGSAFLVSPAAMGQRLVRAKQKIRQAGIPFAVPDRAELGERLDAVLDAIYATFAEGWTDPAGTEARRRDLTGEGIWLGRLVVSLLPAEPEALGLLALMLHAEARRAARRSATGDYVPLAEQDPAQWGAGLIDEAEDALARAGFTKRCSTSPARPWWRINRAIAVAETSGAAAGLRALDDIADDARLAEYQPYWAARATLLARAGDKAASADAYRRAIGLETDPAVRRFLQDRLDRL